MQEPTLSRGGSGLRLATLLGLLLLGGWLRFAGLGWGLRHPVHFDERNYVENTVKMVQAKNLDHRYYLYPGLFFYLLAPPIALLGPVRMTGPDAYLVSRAVVATFGVLNIALLYVIGSRLAGAWAGFVGALLLAVLPLDITTSHQVRPEVLLETAAIVTLAALGQVGNTLQGDALAGVVIGLGTAVKYSAPLLFPSYLLARSLKPGRRLRGMLIAGALIVAIPMACTPYAILHASAYSKGPRSLLSAYYSGERSFARHLAYYLRDVQTALGWFAVGLAFIGGMICLRKAWRTWAPLLLHPIVVLVVMATAALVFPRQMLQAMPLLCLFAGVAVGAIAGRYPWAAVCLALLAALGPFRAALSAVEGFRWPSAQDRGLDWIEAMVPAGSRILETRPESFPGVNAGAAIGVDPHRYEVMYYLSPAGPQRKRDLGLLVAQVDLVITGDGGGGSWARDLTPVYRAPGEFEFRVPTRSETCSAVEVAHWSSSENEDGLRGLGVGGRWVTSGPIRGGEWLQADLKGLVAIGRVEVSLGNAPWRRPPELAIATSRDREPFEDVETVVASPDIKELMEAHRALGQVVVMEPRPAHSVRIRQIASGDLPWVVSEVRIEECRANRWPRDVPFPSVR